jgi:hypothetical protein
MEDQPIVRPLPTHRTAQPQNKRRQTFLLQLRFEPTTPPFDRAKILHALEVAASVVED